MIFAPRKKETSRPERDKLLLFQNQKFNNEKENIGHVPKNIFQTWHTLDLPKQMQESVDNLKTLHSDFQHFLYDDEMCRKFLVDNFPDIVVYTFDKLKPGAYKSDLWRYCVLFIHGGIYLDIKYKCQGSFTFHKLLHQEHWTRDRYKRNSSDTPPFLGVYQGCIICFPRNDILHRTICQVIYNVKNNIYGQTDLYTTGPHLLTKHCFTNEEINGFDLSFNGNGIMYHGTQILNYYSEYRDEQKQHQNTDYYAFMWYKKNIFHYPKLVPTEVFDLSRTITRNNINYFSSTPCILKIENGYEIVLKWINYNYHEDGSKNVNRDSRKWRIMNSYFRCDDTFHQIGSEVYSEDRNIEDVRLFMYNHEIVYISCCDNELTKRVGCSGGIVEDLSTFFHSKRVLQKTFNNNKHEKNWVFCNLQGKLKVVYKWFPLTLCDIDFQKQIIENPTFKYMPKIFEQIRGSTCGIEYKDEIWFIVHITETYHTSNILYANYLHMYVIFDKNMDLLRYSEPFRFEGKRVEFCTSMHIEDNTIILGYSLLDTTTIIAKYDMDIIRHSLRWYKNEVFIL